MEKSSEFRSPEEKEAAEEFNKKMAEGKLENPADFEKYKSKLTPEQRRRIETGQHLGRTSHFE